uniref:Uncharacterized protein n=1 Tax=Noctiluca scintillans TaxID=2966 RepID=A0A7S1ALN9_NOCSC|mmetsp:Transcript_51471/g.137350  ORF Transcript_51471/g.137350 Transcript_51471/m.137350 type:complete len:114 (+) Transcript_51471:139-480(+)
MQDKSCAGSEQAGSDAECENHNSHPAEGSLKRSRELKLPVEGWTVVDQPTQPQHTARHEKELLQHHPHARPTLPSEQPSSSLASSQYTGQETYIRSTRCRVKNRGPCQCLILD